VKAFAVGRYGSKDGLQMREVPEPGIGEHDVLVEVRAASVNLLDAKIRDGEFKRILPYRVPFVLGNDMAGVVVRVGPAVRSFAPGDEVYARMPSAPSLSWPPSTRTISPSSRPP
jgi:NADPH:quinone reductase-like Zn-dependent oxidoreductase